MEKWLLWPDTHFPREDKRKVAVMFQIVKKWKPNYISFLGDLDDMESPARWAAGLKEEVEQRLVKTVPTTTKFLREIRKAAPKAELDWFMGNHEDRLPTYIAKNAKALEGLVTYDTVYPMEELGINWYHYGQPPVRKHGGFHIYHGVLLGQNAGDAARKEAEKWGVSGFSGHTHSLGSYRKTKLGGHVEWFECGHLSDVAQMGYVAAPNWQHGFAYAYIDGKTVYPFLAPFRGNKAVLDGVKFE